MVSQTYELVKCNNCGLDFEKSLSEIKRSKTGNHYCSKSCSASKNNLFIQRNKPLELVCEHCGKTFIRSRTHRSKLLCISCKHLNPLKEMSISDCCIDSTFHPSWKFARIRSFNRSWNKHLTTYSCVVCGYSKHVELAHIIPLSSFPEDTKLSVVNDPSNILVLCPNHHWEFDNKLLSLTDIPSR